MELYKEGCVTSDMMLEGKESDARIPAVQVIGECLNAVKEDAKQLMREAAVYGGLITHERPASLMLVLEPEAASTWCLRDINNNLKSGDVYIVVDCRGGTINVTVHELLNGEQSVKEAIPLSGGDWGSTVVNHAFATPIEELCGGINILPFQRSFREEFEPALRVIVPSLYGDCVMMGAILLANRPEAMAQRISRFSYGTCCYQLFREGYHPTSHRVEVEGKVGAKDCASWLQGYGEEVTFGFVVPSVYEGRARRIEYIEEGDRDVRKLCVICSDEDDPEQLQMHGSDNSANSTVYKQLAMGNAVSSAFAISDQIGSGGPNQLWKIYSATRRSNNQPVSVFIFEKNLLDSLLLNYKPANIKKEQDRANELLRKEAQTLSRLRHPSMLEVTEALADSPTALAFGSEPVLCCLSNVLGSFVNFTVSREEFRNKYDLDELEGDWKIAGFSFSVQYTSSALESTSFYLQDFPPFCAPSMDYLAPELVLDDKCFISSDCKYLEGTGTQLLRYCFEVWSLGCLIYAVFNNGGPPFNVSNNTHTYRQKTQKLHEVDFDKKSIPMSLRGPLRRLLAKDPHNRLSLAEFQQTEFFDNILISTINFLETLVEKPQVNKAQFLKGLVKMLPQFTIKLVVRKILPILLQELKDPFMTPFILPNVFWISEQISDEEFNAKVFPALKPVFRMTDVMPLLYGALDLPVIQVQEQAVRMVPSIVEKLDFTTIKSSLFPKLQHIYQHSSSLAVRVGSLIAIHSTVKLLDKFTLVEKIIPLLKQNKLREPSILVALLAVYAELAKQLDKDLIAIDVLPELWKMSIDQVLNVTQFKKFMKVIHELTAKVEEQHLKVLEEMKTMEG
ncbi:SCY1-like protein 2 [Irineochytrium annulatum]|nr:SCY1-like protein 2 [Irineochytrium annulatum]